MNRILIVDDEPLTAEILQAQLELAGFDSDAAANGGEALALFAPEKYALIITDCSMPVMDGFALTTELRLQDFKGPIVGLTGAGSTDVDTGIAAGMSVVFSKPLRLNDVNRMLDEWMP